MNTKCCNNITTHYDWIYCKTAKCHLRKMINIYWATFHYFYCIKQKPFCALVSESLSNQFHKIDKMIFCMVLKINAIDIGRNRLTQVKVTIILKDNKIDSLALIVKPGFAKLHLAQVLLPQFKNILHDRVLTVRTIPMKLNRKSCHMSISKIPLITLYYNIHRRIQ